MVYVCRCLIVSELSGGPSRSSRLRFKADGDVRVAGELPSIRHRRCAPEIESVGRAKKGSEARSATQGTDDSVFGVVELQSVRGVGELRCAGGCGPGRRE
jgi:hypothetical protein